jgi:hypothetical protein
LVHSDRRSSSRSGNCLRRGYFRRWISHSLFDS